VLLKQGAPLLNFHYPPVKPSRWSLPLRAAVFGRGRYLRAMEARMRPIAGDSSA
jgi:hypothetical protein